MTNRNSYLSYAKRILRRMLQHEKDVQKRQDIQDSLWAIDRGIFTYEQWITDAKMIGLRNPAFDGDFIGWLEDDTDDEDNVDKT
jgi:hypothetical protein